MLVLPPVLTPQLTDNAPIPQDTDNMLVLPPVLTPQLTDNAPIPQDTDNILVLPPVLTPQLTDNVPTPQDTDTILVLPPVLTPQLTDMSKLQRALLSNLVCLFEAHSGEQTNNGGCLYKNLPNTSQSP